MRLPSKSNRSEASSYLSPRRSHGVLIEAGAFMVRCAASHHEGWYEGEILKDMWRAFPSELDEQGIPDWETSFVDSTFIDAFRR